MIASDMVELFDRLNDIYKKYKSIKNLRFLSNEKDNILWKFVQLCFKYFQKKIIPYFQNIKIRNKDSRLYSKLINIFLNYLSK